jgi:hypothetical protein
MYDSKKEYRHKDSGSMFDGHIVNQLHRFYLGQNEYVPWVGVCKGRMVFYEDNDPRLVEVDEVVGYSCVYEEGVGVLWGSLFICIERGHKDAKGRIAIHASGRVRNIPLDATTDPEAQ